MDQELVRVLLVEDNAGDARLLQAVLAEAGATEFELTRVERLGDALKRLAEEPFGVVLLDLSLPDSWGLDTVARTREEAPHLPIVVLTGSDDDALAARALQAGAQDYIPKGQVSGSLLVRSLRYALERHRLLTEFRSLSLVDELTGLYNRRGFLTLAQQQLKTAHRAKREVVLLFADLDGLKSINDALGHNVGDLALTDFADILRRNFREADVVARIGGDEFAILAYETSEPAPQVMAARLQENVTAHNAQGCRSYQLSVSVGTAIYDPERPCTIDELLSWADASMYETKRHKRRL